VAGLASQFPEAQPRGPIAAQKTLLAGRSDQALEISRVVCLRAGGRLLQMALEHLVRQRVSALEALDESVAQLCIPGLCRATSQTLTQAHNGVFQRCQI